MEFDYGFARVSFLGNDLGRFYKMTGDIPMRALEFVSISADGTLAVPPAVAAQLPAGPEPVRVLLLVPDGDEAASWERLTAEQFLAGYADSDAIYDQLSTG